MNADATQPALPVGWFFGLLGLALFGIAVGLLIEGEVNLRRARREFVRGDRLDVYGDGEQCTHPGCAQARALAVARIRQAIAEHARIEWTADTDRELAALLDGDR